MVNSRSRFWVRNFFFFLNISRKNMSPNVVRNWNYSLECCSNLVGFCLRIFQIFHFHAISVFVLRFFRPYVRFFGAYVKYIALYVELPLSLFRDWASRRGRTLRNPLRRPCSWQSRGQASICQIRIVLGKVKTRFENIALKRRRTREELKGRMLPSENIFLIARACRKSERMSETWKSDKEKAWHVHEYKSQQISSSSRKLWKFVHEKKRSIVKKNEKKNTPRFSPWLRAISSARFLSASSCRATVEFFVSMKQVNTSRESRSLRFLVSFLKPHIQASLQSHISLLSAKQNITQIYSRRNKIFQYFSQSDWCTDVCAPLFEVGTFN